MRTVWVYRNGIKALPWYTQVRRLLQDQSFWGWFVPYDGCKTAAGYVCKNNVTGAVDATANLYHDELQTPGCVAVLRHGESHRLDRIRDLEEQLQRYRNEDSDIIRWHAAKSADHAAALRHEEEKGYERGLHDARLQP